MKLWLFGSYKWQGNPKALMMYMAEHSAKTHEVWWVADSEQDATLVSSLGYHAVVSNSKKARGLFSNADVYITENFREKYPTEMNPDIKIINLWHGVGLKHIELALGAESALAESIVRKYVRNFELYKNNLKFLATSKAMEDHFIEDMPLDESQIIRGGYPRNQVYQFENMRTDNGALDFIEKYDDVYLFAPTYRFTNVNGSFKKLLPNLGAVAQKMADSNSLFIIKLHPFMLEDPEYLAALEEYEDDENVYFWDDKYDVYEIFNKITVGVIDYSSIFYDMLESGVERFIRYIPDYDQYVNDLELVGDYFELTDGVDAYSFAEFIDLLGSNLPVITKKADLLNHFFEYDAGSSVDALIEKIDNAVLNKKEYKTLHTFDIFDTLIRRNTVEPEGIFYLVQKKMATYSGNSFSNYLVENYPVIRHQVEFDLRDVFRKTTFERDTDKIEVTLAQILDRLKNNFDLDDQQVQLLYNAEVEAEIEAVEPIQSRIDELHALQAEGADVYLVSDMYLPKDVIKKMIAQADESLVNIPLYVSSEIGYQKSTGRLFTYIFFDKKYEYAEWIHHGDNKRADGTVPRRIGINTVNHDMDSFLPFEETLINKAPNDIKYDMFKLATAMHRYRWSHVDDEEMTFDSSKYFAFAYVGSILVPYVDWAINDAIRRGYQTVYFISRDGYYLKQIADVLIDKNNLNIKSEFVYGSRKAWRVPSFINEVDPASFTPFGMFSNMDTFEDLVKASQLSEKELLDLIPDLEGYKNEPTLRGDIAVGIRQLFENSDEYKERLLNIAAEKRGIVREYLQQTINFDEKFAFIEFWGRGYTQDTFTRLLIDAAGKEVDNPFYYVRNYTPDYGRSIRHRFTQMPVNFTDFESIFATTPYKSIPGYYYGENGKVEPVFESQWNEYNEAISAGIQQFAAEFSKLGFSGNDTIQRYVAETVYQYYFDNPQDQFITDVFANYKDNVSMYGDTQEFAPALSADVVLSNSIAELKQMTKNLEISLSRSTDEARQAFEIRQKIEKLPVKKLKPRDALFPKNDLSNYVVPKKLPAQVVLLKDQFAYASVGWNKNSKKQEELSAFTILEVSSVEWTATGVPRLRTRFGYITAHVNYVATLRDDIDQYIYEDVKQVTVVTPTYYYRTVAFGRPDRIDEQAKRGQKIDVLAVEWTKNGTPRLKTANGYITANKNYVSIDPKMTALRKKAVKGIVKRLTK